ncbi:MAG: ABC transporter ATP-binding protein [Cytophagaceae bacterium]|nr:ABC transporter ATP-binding protein [Cytophagaceae bacterium]
MAHIEVRNLTLGFPLKPLLTNLTFDIKGPSFVGILGHNGCGKTTFFKSLVNQHPYQGQILIDGKEIKNIPDLSASGLITLLEQKNHVNFGIPVKDLVVMGCFRKKVFFENYNSADYKTADEILSALGISHLAEKDYLELSGGEQQIVWLAQVMMQDTQIVLLDEPTQQLDLYNKKKVFSLMQSWVSEYKKTVLCITHDVVNLMNVEGYVLNLSAENIRLEEINNAGLKKNIELLERQKSEQNL